MSLRHVTAAAFVAGFVTLAVSAVRGEEDHLEGFKVKDPTKFKPSGTYTVDNQFGTATCELKKAKFFLVQGEKNNGDDPRGGPAGHFVCYIAKCSGGLPTSNTEVDDQFGTHTLEAKKTQLVCVPADKHVCGDNDLDPGEQCDGTAGGACPGNCLPNCTCPPQPPCEATTAGFCWFLGNAAESCDTVCTAAVRAYDSATASYAGSGGTLANCQAVYTALGLAGSIFDSFCGIGLGCSGNGYRCTDQATTSSAALAGISRICACQ